MKIPLAVRPDGKLFKVVTCGIGGENAIGGEFKSVFDGQRSITPPSKTQGLSFKEACECKKIWEKCLEIQDQKKKR